MSVNCAFGARSTRMRTFIALLLLQGALGGCSLLPWSRLYAPESFGLAPVTSSIFVEAGADEATREGLRIAMGRAETAICAAYGSVNSSPKVHACISEECYERFGGQGSRAKVYGDRILLSPRGLNWHYLAHEWSHAELHSRLTLSAWWRMPQWFDEGVAVAISEAPENSEAHWQFLVDANIPRPTREELHDLKSLKQWDEAVGRFGEKRNAERRKSGEPEIRPVYTAAGHELRPWLAKVGQAGLLSLIMRLNDGEEFASMYEQTISAKE